MKNKVVKKIISICLATTMVVALSACGGGAKESPAQGSDDAASTKEAASTEEAAPAEATGGDDVTIRVSTRFSADVPRDSFYRESVEAFNALDNGITVEMDNIGTESDYLDKLRTSFANGDTPNVFIEYGGSRVLDYVEADALVDFKPYFDADQEWYDGFHEPMFGKLMYQDYPGQIWGAPCQAYVLSLYYNRDIFAEQNLEVPETWDDLLDVCEQLLAAGIQPFQVGAKDAWRLGHLHNNITLKSIGGTAPDILADRSVAYDSPEMIETYRKIAELVDKGYLGAGILDTDYETEKAAYADEQCAMRWDGSWYISEIFGTEIYDKTSAARIPSIDPAYADAAQGGASDMWFVSKLNKSDEEIEASIAFLKYFTSPEHYAKDNEVAAAIQPIKFTVTADTPANPLLEEASALLAGYTSVADDLQTYDGESHMLDTVRNALQGIAMGNSPEQCAAEIMERIEERGE